MQLKQYAQLKGVLGKNCLAWRKKVCISLCRRLQLPMSREMMPWANFWTQAQPQWLYEGLRLLFGCLKTSPGILEWASYRGWLYADPGKPFTAICVFFHDTNAENFTSRHDRARSALPTRFVLSCKISKHPRLTGLHTGEIWIQMKISGVFLQGVFIGMVFNLRKKTISTLEFWELWKPLQSRRFRSSLHPYLVDAWRFCRAVELPLAFGALTLWLFMN